MGFIVVGLTLCGEIITLLACVCFFFDLMFYYYDITLGWVFEVSCCRFCYLIWWD